MSTMHKTETGAVRSCEYSGGLDRPEKNRLDLLLKNREALETYAEAYARGMRKYGRDNWMKGFKESILLQHTIDHLIHYVNGTCDPGEEDVDQLSGVLWNIGTLCHMRKHKPELMDVTGPDPGPENKVEQPMRLVTALGSPDFKPSRPTATEQEPNIAELQKLR